jgi:hypothetical protein
VCVRFLRGKREVSAYPRPLRRAGRIGKEPPKPMRDGEKSALRFRTDLQHRLATFGLALHPAKTRQIEVVKFAVERRARRRRSTSLVLRTSAASNRGKSEFQLMRRTDASAFRRSSNTSFQWKVVNSRRRFPNTNKPTQSRETPRHGGLFLALCIGNEDSRARTLSGPGPHLPEV